jgi:hypothetical protein
MGDFLERAVFRLRPERRDHSDDDQVTEAPRRSASDSLPWRSRWGWRYCPV